MTIKEFIKKVNNWALENGLEDKELDYTPDVKVIVANSNGRKRTLTYDVMRDEVTKTEIKVQVEKLNNTKKTKK